MKKFVAFTLAEVLVTLGIIGVVSALTVPNLVKNHQKHVYVTQLRKTTSEIEQAFKNALVENRTTSLREARVFSGGAGTFLQGYLETNILCSGASKSDCLNTGDYTKINGDALNLGATLGVADYQCAVLKDGAAVCIKNNGNEMYVDINGKQGPNIAGRDLYKLYFQDNGKFIVKHPAHAYFPTVDEENAYTKLVVDGWEMNY